MNRSKVERALNLLVQASRVSPPLREAVAVIEDAVRRLYDRDEQLRDAILDIDAHATPLGEDDDGFITGGYTISVGCLHRALGLVGHASPRCKVCGPESHDCADWVNAPIPSWRDDPVRERLGLSPIEPASPDPVRGSVGSPSGSGSAGEASTSGSMPARGHTSDKDARDVLADRIETWADTQDWHVYDYVDRLIGDLDQAGFEVRRKAIEKATS